MSLRPTIKRLIRKTFPHATIKRSAAEHDRLTRLDTRLPPKLLDGAKLLTDREALLHQMPRGAQAAEIGVAQGHFSREIVRITEPAKLYLIDAWAMAMPQFGQKAYEDLTVHFADAISEGGIEIRRGWSWDMIATLPDESLDWAYVDASHDFDPVKKDLEALRTKIRPGGYLCGHDYIRWSRNSGRFGVVEAVHRFAIENEWPLAFLTLEGNFNESFALQRPA